MAGEGVEVVNGKASGVALSSKASVADGNRQRWLLYFWAAVACVSVGQGVLTSLKPGQSQDFYLVYNWAATWLWEGNNPYYWVHGYANYPPHALLLLSLITLIPARWAALAWPIVNIALAAASSFIVFKLFKPDAQRRAWLLPCLMFLAWAGIRVGLGNGQWSLLIFFMGLLYVRLADAAPNASGLFLAASLMKPHIGAAFFLWALLTKRFRAVLVAVCVMGLGLLLYSARVGESPLLVTQTFVSVLRAQFGGQTFLPGVVELRPLVHALIPNFALAEAFNITTVFVLLGLIVIVALKAEILEARTKEIVLLQLCSMWTLLSVFHYPYDMPMMLPVMMSLYFYRLPHPDRPSAKFDRAIFWLLQIALVVQVSSVWWKLSRRADVSGYELAGALMWHFDRVLTLAFFLLVAHRARLLWRERRESSLAGEPLVAVSSTSD